jgi:hypothetical protein
VIDATEINGTSPSGTLKSLLSRAGICASDADEVHRHVCLIFTTEGTEAHSGILIYASVSPCGEPVLRLVAVPVHLPAEVSNGGFVDGACRSREVGGYVVLESVLADVVQQLLEVWNLDHADTTKGIQ